MPQKKVSKARVRINLRSLVDTLEVRVDLAHERVLGAPVTG